MAKYQPVRVTTNDWRTTIVPWYRNLADLGVPVLWDRGEPGMSAFKAIAPSEVARPPAVPVATEGTVVSEKVEGNKITFETTAIGQPHWIKVSYFPNWHVKGADGPYVASPSFMMVIPRQREVTLYYGRTASNTLGQILTLLGWAIVVFLLVRSLRSWRAARTSAPVADVGAASASDAGIDAVSSLPPAEEPVASGTRGATRTVAPSGGAQW